MKHLLIMLFLIPACAFGQAASQAEQLAVALIAPCIVEGAPEDWSKLTMVIRLEKAGDETGGVRYFATRASAPDEVVAYLPCDRSRPARALLEARKELAEDRRGWIGARLVLERDGKFALGYDYP